MIETYKTSFVVYPEHTNSMSPMIFGGAFFSELDKAAAVTVRRILYSSNTCEAAVTHKAEVTFHMPCYLNDLVFIESKIVDLGKKSVVVEVKAYREKHRKFSDHQEDVELVPELVAEAKFVFVTVEHVENVANKPRLLPYLNHGLKM